MKALVSVFLLAAGCVAEARVARPAPAPLRCEQRGAVAVYETVPTDPDGTGALDGDTLCVTVRPDCQRADPRASLDCHLAYFLRNGRNDYYGVRCPRGEPARVENVTVAKAYWKPGHETACWENVHVTIDCDETCSP